MKLGFLCHDRWQNSQAEPILRVADELKDRDVEVRLFACPSNQNIPEAFWPHTSEEFESHRRSIISRLGEEAARECDMLLIHHRAIQPSHLRLGAPIVILEHTDAASLEWSKYFIHLPQIVGVIKGTVFTDRNLYNAACCEGMYHGTLMNDYNLPVKNPKFLLDDSHLDKIELGYSFGCFPANSRFLAREIDGNREINVSFVGSTNYPRSKLVTSHRQRCWNVCNSIGFVASKLSRQDFDDIMYKSKACLSPYGYGACYRSFEAMYAGTIAIQPDSSYVESWPNVYVEGETYFRCRSDFEDAQSIVNDIVSRWGSLTSLREKNRNTLIDSYWNQDVLANHLSGIFHRCLDRYDTL